MFRKLIQKIKHTIAETGRSHRYSSSHRGRRRQYHYSSSDHRRRGPRHYSSSDRRPFYGSSSSDRRYSRDQRGHKYYKNRRGSSS
ncbi:hypothetical protein D3C77_431360 [compost metagenome]